MRNLLFPAVLAIAFTTQSSVLANPAIMKANCADCHNDKKAKGKFNLRLLGDDPTTENVKLWEESLENVRDGDMPPEDESKLSKEDRQRLVQFLGEKIQAYHKVAGVSTVLAPRRLNNRELAKSVADVLLIEDVGTNQPTANLVGDSLKAGFDTDGDALGISEFQMDQYIEAFRKIVDNTIFSTPRPPSGRLEVKPGNITVATTSQTKDKQKKKLAKDEDADRKYVDLLDPRTRLCFSNFQTAPATGRYRIKIHAAGVDRGIYDASESGIYKGDPVQLAVQLGDRVHTIDLPDNKPGEIVLDEWISAGTKLQFYYPTDGLRMRGNGNFKFQYGIAEEYLKEHDPKRYARSEGERIQAGYLQGPSHLAGSAPTLVQRGDRRPDQRELAAPATDSLAGDQSQGGKRGGHPPPHRRTGVAPEGAGWRIGFHRQSGQDGRRQARRHRGAEGRHCGRSCLTIFPADQSRGR